MNVIQRGSARRPDSGGESPSTETVPTIVEYVERHARHAPCNPAVLQYDRTALSFGDLQAQVRYIQGALGGLTLGRNDRIGIALPNDGNMVTALLGVVSCAVAVPLNPSLTEAEFDEYLALVNVNAVIVEAERETPAKRSARRAGLTALEVVDNADAPAGVFRFEGIGSVPLGPLDKPSAHDVAVVQLTTGSTSRPKSVPLDHQTLARRALKHANWVSLDATDRGLLFMPLFHGQGLNMGIFPSVVVGGSIVVVPDFNVDGFLGLVEEFQPTWYTASPAHHRAILAKGEACDAAIKQCSLRFIRSGSQHLSPQLIAKLARPFGAPVIETYNTSETGQLAGGLLSDPATVGDMGLAISDDVAIMDDTGKLLPPGDVGEVVARGDSVFDGYDDPGENGEVAFVKGWFRTGDLGTMTPDGRLFLKGRKKELINRGGEKIAPMEIDQALEAHPAVESAISFAIPHPSLGEQVGAAVIMRQGASATESELRQFAQSRLASFKVPRRIAFVNEFPLGPSAKADRKALAEIVTSDWERPGARGGQAQEELTTLQARILEVWQFQLERDDIGIEDDFFMLGGDSLQAIDLFLQLEKELGITLSPTVLFEAGTISEMARLIESEQPEDILVPLNDGGDLRPFFCVHDGAANVIGFRHLAKRLGRNQPFYGLQPTWAFGKGQLLTRIEDMARSYVDAVRTIQPVGPYVIGGYSFGGKIAYEMAQQMTAAGDEVSLLVLIDSHLYGPKPSIGVRVRGHLKFLSRLNATDMVSYLGERVADRARRFARFLSDRVSKPLHDVAKEQHAAGRTLAPRLVQAVSSMASRRYKPEKYAGRAVLFHTTLHPAAHPDIHDRWRELVHGRIDFIHVPGDHSSILRAPDVDYLADRLRRCLELARAADPDR